MRYKTRDMARLYLVRHAKPAAAWGEDPDPGLDNIGEAQAVATARRLAEVLARIPVYSSPLRRCRETAGPLAAVWTCAIQIFPAAAEIPSPPIGIAARRDWLTSAMRGTWTQLNDSAPAGSIDYLGWRQDLIESLLAIPRDTVLYTHFIAINAAVGAARGGDQVVCFRPDHASVTVIDTDSSRMHVLELGRQGDTAVLTGR